MRSALTAGGAGSGRGASAAADLDPTSGAAPAGSRPESTLDLLRRRPELTVGPALAVWLVANGLPIVSGRPFLLSLVGTATFHGNAGNAFPVTYGLAVALFGFTLWVERGLGWPRRLLVALAVPFAFTHLFEVPYELIAYSVWPEYYHWALWPIVLFLNASWLVLGVSTFPYWRLRWKGIIALLAFLVTCAIWWVFFWPFIPPIALPLNPQGSGYIVSHVFLAALLFCVLWDGRFLRSEQTVPMGFGPRNGRPNLRASPGARFAGGLQPAPAPPGR